MIEKRSIFFWHLVLLEVTKDKKKRTTPPISFASFCLFSYLVWKLWAWDCELLHDIQKEKKNKKLNQRAYGLEWSLSLSAKCSLGFFGGTMEGGILKVAKNEKAGPCQSHTLCDAWVFVSSREQSRRVPPLTELGGQSSRDSGCHSRPKKAKAKDANQVVASRPGWGGKAVHPTAILCLYPRPPCLPQSTAAAFASQVVPKSSHPGS